MFVRYAEVDRQALPALGAVKDHQSSPIDQTTPRQTSSLLGLLSVVRAGDSPSLLCMKAFRGIREPELLAVIQHYVKTVQFSVPHHQSPACTS